MGEADIAFVGRGFTILRTVVGPLDNNVLLVRDDSTSRAVIIDAADEPPAVITLAGNTDVSAVLTTHGHWDHHGAVPEVSEALGVPFALHSLDEEIAGKRPDLRLEEGRMSVGETPFDVVHTPGHTPGSVCLVFDGTVITGDTLFPGGPGATRFPYSSFDQIIASITERLFTLPDDTVVLPGHGESTTIGTERPQLPAWIARRW